MNLNSKQTKAPMTKTMQELIERAKSSPNRPNISVVQRTCGTGPKGGRINHGSRESKALHDLMKLGLVEIVDTYKVAIPNSGSAIWVYDTTYRVLV